MKILFFVFWSLTTFAARIPISPQASWKIAAPNLSAFTLLEDKMKGQTMYAISYGKGQRVSRTFPVPQDEWMKWKSKLSLMMTAFPKSQNCANPHLFVVEKKSMKPQSKTFCYAELSADEKKSMQALLGEFKKYLYGQ